MSARNGGAEDGRFTPSRLIPMEEALGFDMFGPDETDVTELSDKIVKAAKDHPHCFVCYGPIAKGERHRAKTERNNEEGKVMTFRACGKCVRAMLITNETYSDRAMISRECLGEQRRRAARASGAAGET